MPSPKRYLKKPVEVEAVQYDEASQSAYEQIVEWTGGISPGAAGIMFAPGDWLLHDADGNLWTLTDETFQATYEEVADGEGEDLDALIEAQDEAAELREQSVDRGDRCIALERQVVNQRRDLARANQALKEIREVHQDERLTSDQALDRIDAIYVPALTQHTTSGEPDA